jgi:hypothetical protein
MPTNRAIMYHTHMAPSEITVWIMDKLLILKKNGDIDIENQSRLHVVQLVVTSLVKHPIYLQHIYYISTEKKVTAKKYECLSLVLLVTGKI